MLNIADVDFEEALLLSDRVFRAPRLLDNLDLASAAFASAEL